MHVGRGGSGPCVLECLGKVVAEGELTLRGGPVVENGVGNGSAVFQWISISKPHFAKQTGPTFSFAFDIIQIVVFF